MILEGEGTTVEAQIGGGWSDGARTHTPMMSASMPASMPASDMSKLRLMSGKALGSFAVSERGVNGGVNPTEEDTRGLTPGRLGMLVAHLVCSVAHIFAVHQSAAPRSDEERAEVEAASLAGERSHTRGYRYSPAMVVFMVRAARVTEKRPKVSSKGTHGACQLCRLMASGAENVFPCVRRPRFPVGSPLLLAARFGRSFDRSARGWMRMRRGGARAPACPDVVSRAAPIPPRAG